MPNITIVVVAAAFTLAAVPAGMSAQVAATNAVYLELGGSGGLLSVNYERRVGAVQLRAGVGNWSFEDSFGGGSEEYFTVPLALSHVRGSGKHHLETGAGVTLGTHKVVSVFGDGTTRSSFVTLTSLLGYRYQKPGSGFVFRASLTPLYGLGDEDVAYPARGFFPSVGISFGAAFK